MGRVKKFKAGEVWTRQCRGKEETFIIEGHLRSDEPGHHPMVVSFPDGSKTIFNNPYNMRNMRTARRIGRQCIDCRAIIFGDSEEKFCEKCDMKTCEACYGDWSKARMQPGEVDGEAVWYCNSCVSEPDPDSKREAY